MRRRAAAAAPRFAMNALRSISMSTLLVVAAMVAAPPLLYSVRRGRSDYFFVLLVNITSTSRWCGTRGKRGARAQVHKGMRMLRLGSGMALIAAAAVTAASQQQPPTFKAGIQTVSLFATVTDATGRLVPDLA